MRDLVQKIVDSYDRREQGIASLRQEANWKREAARAQVSDQHRARSQAGTRLRAELERGKAELANGEGRRKSDAGAWMTGVRQDQEARSRQVRSGLDEARADRARAESNRRAAALAGMAEAGASRRSNARALRENLKKGRSDLAESAAGSKRLAVAWMQDAAKGRGDMSRRLRSDLDKARSDRLAREQSRHAATGSALATMAQAHAEAASEWRSLAQGLKARRSAAASEEDAIARQQKSSAAMSTLRGQVFDYLASHPSGTRLDDLGREYHLGRFQIDKVVKELIKEGKVEKRDRLYFAI